MTDDTMPFLDALLKRGGGDFMKQLAEEVLGRLMAYDIEGRIGAARYERNDERTTQRNGYRERAFDTRLGMLDRPAERQAKFTPNRHHRRGKLGHQMPGMGRRRSDAQALGAAGHRRIVDRLDVDAMPLKEQIARLFAEIGIADQDGHDMGRRRHHRQAGGYKGRLGRSHGRLVVGALDLGDLQVGD